MTGNGRPLSRKKTVQLMVILTIFAWATQTLLHQWGFGQTIPESAPSTQPADQTIQPGEEKFLPRDASIVGGTLEIRGEATVVGGEVKLKQICRWSDNEAATFAPIADLILCRLGAGAPYREVSLSDVKTILHDAGINIANINFVGSMTCAVNRSDVHVDEGEALKKWIEAHENTQLATIPATQPSGQPSTQPALPAQPVLAKLASAKVEPDPKSSTSLRDYLIGDISTRLGLPREALQISFRQQDERLLNLAEPLFKFQIDQERVRDLGEVSWSVTVFTDGNSSTQKAQIAATARAWQSEIVIARPMSCKQVIRDQDVVERRTLISHLPDDTVLDRSQALGQQASRDLKPGQVVTARMVDAVQLVRAGQFVTVVYRQGSVELKTVARALDSGSFGQAIRVKNEATRDIYDVVLTGPQTASMTSTANPNPVSPGVASAHD